MALTPEEIAELKAIADDIPAGRKGEDVAARLDWLIELLVERGDLAPAHHRIAREVRADHSPRTVRLRVIENKRAIKGPDIDCASLLHLCHARCCSLQVELSPEDLEDRRLKWDLEEPYVLRRSAATGYCENLESSGRCCVYEDRPAMCRNYDCRKDPRVWKDFDNKIPVEPPYHIVPLGEWDNAE
jgi:Fe-S-cluster containining protein